MCSRIEVAGSVRRQAPTVGDIEMLAIPKLGDRPGATSLFAEPCSLLELELQKLADERKLLPVKGGEKFRQYIIATVPWGPQLDLFITTPPQWGVIFAIRTGPARYSRWIVTQRCAGGGLNDDCRVKDGFLWRGLFPADVPATRPEGSEVFDDHVYERIDTPEESDFFTYVDGGLKPPSKRWA